MDTQLTLAYAAGPGDVVKTFRYWQQGKDDPNQVAITYSAQFFDLCTRLNAKGIVLSSNPRKDRITTKQFHIENIPAASPGSGLRFHFNSMFTSLRFLRRARRLGANIFVISDATGHWFPFSLLNKAHEIYIPSLHCVFWSRFSPLSAARRFLNRLESSFFRKKCAGILTVSHEITGQVQEIAVSGEVKTRVFHPVYRPGTFSEVEPPPGRTEKFRVFFAGRLEADKGIYDLLEMAKELKARGRTDIVFDILGTGSEDENLRTEAARSDLAATFRIHGYCRRPRLLELLSQSHVIIVPTSTQFHEGFNKVVAEGVLSGRPVITSSACPALYSVQDAVVEVPPDDFSAYLEAIVQLCEDRHLYEQKRQACVKLAAPFYDVDWSWGKALEEAVRGAVKDLMKLQVKCSGDEINISSETREMAGGGGIRSSK